ncbi:protein DpdE [Chlorogloea sp. CCALA 695]|uniref:protein DpdE n=1 Tax=Chlorogloea sp. CCALA 695 TaxID=2107693 RepID=UPI000D060D08|nr:protein DpdE [Chlorogloea sp. CCALA 695]PSB33288.1 helicase [Chlorogloea sp. CCALA 695]
MTTAIEFGCLVRSRNSLLGIGKVTEITPDHAVVEYFCSMKQRIHKTLPLDSLQRVRLPKQTRCYLYVEDKETWTIGRVYAEDNYEYQIDLPDRQTIVAIEQEIYVRCDRPITDPIEILAMKGHETPYFHAKRSRFVQCLLQQRAVSRGMTGLISANIALYPHQVEVVRRVLEDPIGRYLLADEVGLGKTIEAGAILRQYLLDEPRKQVLIVVPQYLLAQWQQELESKFYLSNFTKRVQLVAVEDWMQISRKDIGFLILDEAHHIAAMASSSSKVQNQCFETYKQLAHKSDRLLLLSATPVLNHEQDFLTMLHLLDPTTYKLEDLAGFSAKVLKRQEIGRVLLAFKPGAKAFVLKTNLSKLQSLFPDDTYLLNLLDQLQQQESTTEIDKMVQVIRNHISDTYRLHRRMLRNRRATVEDVIFDRNAIPKTEDDLDERSNAIHELLEEWRTVAPSGQYTRIFLLLFRAAGTWLGVLKAVVTTRLKGVSNADLVKEFGNEDVRLLVETPKFSGEEEILQALLKILQQPSEDGDRLELLQTILLYHLSEVLKLQSYKGDIVKLLEQVQKRIDRPINGDFLPKIIVFTSFVQTCAELNRYLVQTFGESAIAIHQYGTSREQAEDNINRFKNNPSCFILISDFSGEEGRNLQFADGLIHFDLPWSPNRLEQRLGRIDRIGGKVAINSWLLAGVDLPDSPHQAWYELLKAGFGIFTQSVASLQFYVDEKLPELENILFNSGATGLIEASAQIQTEIETEQVKISEQNVLDDIDANDENALSYFQELETYDDRHQELQKATESWLCSALQFLRVDNPDLAGVCQYQPSDRTLVPANVLVERFSTQAKKPGTYNRRVANKHSGIDLYRIGEGFTEKLASYMYWDDRGQAFAMWRHDKAWDAGEGTEWLGFRFDYTVEANLTFAKDSALNKLEIKTLRRRADALFPPKLETVFVNARMEIVEDTGLLNILQRPYYGKDSDYRDYNLAKDRLSIIDEFIDPGKWSNFCQLARKTSEKLLRDRTSFGELCQQRAKVATLKLDNRLNQLQLRLDRVSEATAKSSLLAEELTNETNISQALVEGIYRPRLKLDSVGFMIISGRSPVGENGAIG